MGGATAVHATNQQLLGNSYSCWLPIPFYINLPLQRDSPVPLYHLLKAIINAMQTQAFTTGTRIGAARRAGSARTTAVRRGPMVVRAAGAAPKEEMVDEMGFKLMRKGVKVAANESILTPR